MKRLPWLEVNRTSALAVGCVTCRRPLQRRRRRRGPARILKNFAIRSFSHNLNQPTLPPDRSTRPRQQCWIDSYASAYEVPANRPCFRSQRRILQRFPMCKHSISASPSTSIIARSTSTQGATIASDPLKNSNFPWTNASRTNGTAFEAECVPCKVPWKDPLACCRVPPPRGHPGNHQLTRLMIGNR